MFVLFWLAKNKTVLYYAIGMREEEVEVAFTLCITGAIFNRKVADEDLLSGTNSTKTTSFQRNIATCFCIGTSLIVSGKDCGRRQLLLTLSCLLCNPALISI